MRCGRRSFRYARKLPARTSRSHDRGDQLFGNAAWDFRVRIGKGCFRHDNRLLVRAKIIRAVAAKGQMEREAQSLQCRQLTAEVAVNKFDEFTACHTHRPSYHKGTCSRGINPSSAR